MAVIKPRTLRGFRDIMPDEMLGREKIVSTIKKVYESYGFVPLATPSLEYAEILLSGGDEEAAKELYMFTDPDGNDVGLPFELTVSLARFIAQHKTLPRPFKRYQVQSVWRYDKPDPGRFREFIQFDIDTVGAKSMAADAEIIAAMSDSLTALGLRFRIRISNRKILNGLVEFIGLPPEMARPVFRIVDKLDKQGLEAVKLELGNGRIDSSGAEIKGLGLSEDMIWIIELFLKLPCSSRKKTLFYLEDVYFELFRSDTTQEGIDELREIHQNLEALGITDKSAVFDLSIARGLDYYTGPVFEAILIGAEEFGSVMGGGRYDSRIGLFTGQDVAATGASIGIDRLLSAIQKLELIESKPSTADVLVTVMDRERMADYQRIAQRLRRAGINTELYLGNQKGIKQQLKYADRLEIPIAVIIGSDEFDAGEVSIKDLRLISEQEIDIQDRQTYLEARVSQKTIPMESMIEEIKQWLKL